jgi:hypothetical protein
MRSRGSSSGSDGRSTEPARTEPARTAFALPPNAKGGIDAAHLKYARPHRSKERMWLN